MLLILIVQFISVFIFSTNAVIIPMNTPLSLFPMLKSHDTGTAYLSTNPLNLINRWTITQKDNITQQLNCGARYFDIRPQVDKDNTTLLIHHGPVVVKHLLADIFQEVIQWALTSSSSISSASTYLKGKEMKESLIASENLIILDISNCVGHEDDCATLVPKLLNELSIPLVSCEKLQTLTLQDALDVSSSPAFGNGNIFAVINCGDASIQTYDDSRECSGFKDPKVTESFTKEANQCIDFSLNEEELIACFNGLSHFLNVFDLYSCVSIIPSAREFAFDRLLQWNKEVTMNPPPTNPNHFISLQGAFAESVEDIVIGFLQGSSLLRDEINSKLNKKLVQWITNGEFKYLPSNIGINNVCDGGQDVIDALREKFHGIGNVLEK